MEMEEHDQEYWFQYGPYFYPTILEEHELTMQKLFAKADKDMASQRAEVDFYLMVNNVLWFGEEVPHAAPWAGAVMAAVEQARKQEKAKEDDDRAQNAFKLSKAVNELAEALADAVSDWHNGASPDLPLHEHLGMTQPEYNTWATNPSAVSVSNVSHSSSSCSSSSSSSHSHSYDHSSSSSHSYSSDSSSSSSSGCD